MSLCAIFEMVYLFVHRRCTYDSAQEITGHSSQTICDWWNMFREAMTISLEAHPLLHGTPDEPIQVGDHILDGKN